MPCSRAQNFSADWGLKDILTLIARRRLKNRSSCPPVKDVCRFLFFRRELVKASIPKKRLPKLQTEFPFERRAKYRFHLPALRWLPTKKKVNLFPTRKAPPMDF